MNKPPTHISDDVLFWSGVACFLVAVALFIAAAVTRTPVLSPVGLLVLIPGLLLCHLGIDRRNNRARR